MMNGAVYVTRSQKSFQSGGSIGYSSRNSSRIAKIVPHKEAWRASEAPRAGFSDSAELGGTRVSNGSPGIWHHEKILLGQDPTPEIPALRLQNPSKSKETRVNVCNIKEGIGHKVIAKSIEYLGFSEFQECIDAIFSLWFPSSQGDHAHAIEFHRKVHEEVNGVGSPLNFAVNFEKEREVYLQYSEKDWLGEHVSHLLKYTWEFTKEGEVQVNFAPATETDEGLAFPMRIELSMLKHEKYSISGSYLLVSSGYKASLALFIYT